MRTKFLQIISVQWHITDTLLTTFIRYLRKTGKIKGAVSQPFTDFKNAYDSVSREVLHNIPSLVYPKINWINKNVLNKTYSQDQIQGLFRKYSFAVKKKIE